MRRLGHATVLLAGISLAACASAPVKPRVFAVPEAGVKPVVRLASVADYPDALAAIADVMERQLDLPVFHASVHLLPDRRAFQAALVARGYREAFARDAARTLDAIGGFRSVLVNEAALSRLSWPERVGLLAHELAHTIQYELGGGRRGASDQWLREGFADWVSWRVLESLGVTTLASLRRNSVHQLRRVEHPRDVPPFEEMVTFEQWVGLRAHQPFAPTYAQAFLAADLLIERHGLPAVLYYFRLFAASEDRLASFQAAFGEDLAAFERVFRSRLARGFR